MKPSRNYHQRHKIIYKKIEPRQVKKEKYNRQKRNANFFSILCIGDYQLKSPMSRVPCQIYYNFLATHLEQNRNIKFLTIFFLQTMNIILTNVSPFLQFLLISKYRCRILKNSVYPLL